MEIIEVTSKPPYDSTPLTLVIGKFDGVHLGHQAVLQTAKEMKGEGEALAVLGFSDHPLWILKKDPEYQSKLTPDQEKMRILTRFGVDRYYRVEFTEEYARITANEFVLEHLSRLNVKRIVVGEGFHFGKGGDGSVTELVNLCSKIKSSVTVVPEIKEHGRKISSTRIRSLVKNGKMEAVQGLLGRPYTITGEVIHGEALGRTLGFPTINLGGTESYIEPKPGVYLGTAEIHHEKEGNEIWNVLISAGYRPTVNGQGYLVEAYLIDYSGDLYGKTASVSFLRYMRGEIKFTGLDALIAQMELDKKEAKELLEIIN
ncbi:bifunctional riboflavin kinase/FAD synthetase [Neobacillus dielmonensis]|uniref:bifunctional riboflavin kinase/FAD synthetase n=1 Tax=Neobacillus dielmonensis TaxID=1347369 RepID=UPI0005A76A1F|nr:bifunctional riboflavin kinase/FAD synthetase [Neobacillus dielmonensis]